jgi:hypothetical protein
MPRSSWETITPELPLAPVRAPLASAAKAAWASVRVGVGARSRASSAARIVCRRFEPVSLSATGKTLIRSMASRCASSDCTQATAQRRTFAASSARSIDPPAARQPPRRPPVDRPGGADMRRLVGRCVAPRRQPLP